MSFIVDFDTRFQMIEAGNVSAKAADSKSLSFTDLTSQHNMGAKNLYSCLASTQDVSIVDMMNACAAALGAPDRQPVLEFIIQAIKDKAIQILTFYQANAAKLQGLSFEQLRSLLEERIVESRKIESIQLLSARLTLDAEILRGLSFQNLDSLSRIAQTHEISYLFESRSTVDSRLAIGNIARFFGSIENEKLFDSSWIDYLVSKERVTAEWVAACVKFYTYSIKGLSFLTNRMKIDFLITIDRLQCLELCNALIDQGSSCTNEVFSCLNSLKGGSLFTAGLVRSILSSGTPEDASKACYQLMVDELLHSFGQQTQGKESVFYRQISSSPPVFNLHHLVIFLELRGSLDLSSIASFAVDPQPHPFVRFLVDAKQRGLLPRLGSALQRLAAKDRERYYSTIARRYDLLRQRFSLPADIPSGVIEKLIVSSGNIENEAGMRANGDKAFINLFCVPTDSRVLEFILFRQQDPFIVAACYHDLSVFFENPPRGAAEFDFYIKMLASMDIKLLETFHDCLLYTSPSPRDRQKSRMPSSA